MRTLLQKIIAWLCRPIEAARERREQREARARDHQLALVREIVKGIEALTDGQVAQAREQGAALTAIATANAAQSEAFSKWFSSFQITSPPTSSVVSEEDEWAREQQKLAEHYGLPSEAAFDLPEEFRLAHELKTNFAAALAADKM